MSGWYPDPADSARQRYWGGDAWTAQTRQTGTPAEEPKVTPIATGDPYAAYSAHTAPGVPTAPPGYYAYPAYQLANVRMTADGVPLSGWWWRVLATWLDGLILSVVSLPFMMGMISGIQQWANDVVSASSSYGQPIPQLTDPAYGLERPYLIYAGVSLVLGLLYPFVMLKLVGATVGQLACGLRVVPVDQGQHKGGLPAGTIAKRLLMYTLLPNGISLVVLVMMFQGNTTLSSLSSLVGLYTLLNVLWAAWDNKSQCLHDKVARTQVIRRG